MDQNTDLITINIENGIATVRLNRPDKRNAMSFDLLKQLHASARELQRDRSLRVVLLAGAGESFSAGIDLGELNNPRNRMFAFMELLRPGQSLFQKAFLAWQDLPVPVIAVLHGHCFGAGMQLALAADIRVASPSCQLSIMEARWGLVPDMGITRTLRGLVPIDVAKELVFSARIFSGSEAKALGLVTHVGDDPMAKALSLAQEFIERSPDAVLAGKRVLDAMVHAPGRALWLEKWWQLKLLLGRNAAIARRKGKAPETAFEPRQYR